jgi:predicted acyl esterase
MGLWLWLAAHGAHGTTISEHEITVRNGSGIPVPIAFTVFQPDGAPDDSFPLVLIGHGWGASRVTEIEPIPASLTIVSDGTLVARAVARGYGVISFDYRGHGDSGGLSHLMDPRWEVRDIAAILDWADANLPWLLRSTVIHGSACWARASAPPTTSPWRHVIRASRRSGRW